MCSSLECLLLIALSRWPTWTRSRWSSKGSPYQPARSGTEGSSEARDLPAQAATILLPHLRPRRPVLPQRVALPGQAATVALPHLRPRRLVLPQRVACGSQGVWLPGHPQLLAAELSTWSSGAGGRQAFVGFGLALGKLWKPGCLGALSLGRVLASKSTTRWTRRRRLGSQPAPRRHPHDIREGVLARGVRVFGRLGARARQGTAAALGHSSRLVASSCLQRKQQVWRQKLSEL